MITCSELLSFAEKTAECRIGERRLLGHSVAMGGGQFLKTRVPEAFKNRVSEAAAREMLTESLWLRRVVSQALRASGESTPSMLPLGAASGAEALSSLQSRPIGAGRIRLCLRLRHDDWLLLRERASRRGMPAATYVAALTRAHFHTLAPLPEAELAALKSCAGALGAIGRNLNQIARIAHRDGRVLGPGREHLELMLKVCEAMRGHIKSLVRSNVQSWESGYVDPDE